MASATRRSGPRREIAAARGIVAATRWTGASGRPHGVVKPRRHEAESGFFYYERGGQGRVYFRERGKAEGEAASNGTQTPASKHFHWNILSLVSCPFFAYIKHKNTKMKLECSEKKGIMKSQESPIAL